MRSITVIAAALALPAATPASAQAQPIEWSIARDGSNADASRVQLTIETRWDGNSRSTWSNDRPIGDLQGLSPAQVTGRSGPVRFALVREAGRLDCAGTAGNFTGRGTCAFSADPAFSAYLESKGIGRPDARDSYSLTMSGVGRRLIDALDSFGYVKPSVRELSSLGIHGVTEDYVRDLAASGYRLGSIKDLTSFRIHGVTVDYIRDMAAIGPQLARLDAKDLVSMRIHGAKPEMVRAYTRLTGGSPNGRDIVSMAIHGVSANYIEEMHQLGYRDLTARQLVSMRIHGVTPDYVRSLQQAGMAQISADQLVRLRIAGFRPR